MIPKSFNKKIFLLLLFSIFWCWPAGAEEFMQVPGVIHIHTTFSSGSHTIAEIVEMAKKKGIKALAITDHDFLVMEYGIFPLRNIIKRREERNSVFKNGADKYLREIERINREQDDVLVIPGVQSSPFYYWTGNPFDQNMIAHDYRKELLLIGMQSKEDYTNLPLLHRGFSTRYIKDFLPQAIIFLAAFMMGLYLFFQSGIMKVLGGIISLFSLLLLVNHHPFQSSRYDPYHGDQGIAPYQELINYVNQRGGLVFWAHPESAYATQGVDLGPVKLRTEPYPDALMESNNYTGFSAIYGDNITVSNPGMQWDRVLNQYCAGERTWPAWGISGADFHGRHGHEKLFPFQTIFLVKDKTMKAYLDALSKGRVYAVQKPAERRLSLDRFEVRGNDDLNPAAIMGGGIKMSGYPMINGRLSSSDNGHYQVKILLIRGGEVMASFEGETPLEFHFKDKNPREGKSYYRLEANGGQVGKLIANPIFVTRAP